jgi:hypothetical protein
LKANHEPLSKLVGLPRNPKLHNLGDIHQSINRFGFVNRILINDTTNHIIAGHGRVETLRQKKVTNQKPPIGVEVRPDDWYVPTDRIEIPEDEEEALAIALNKIGENEWDDVLTAQILADLAAKDNLQGTGFDGDDVDYLLRKAMPHQPSETISDEDLNKYREERSHWRWLRLHITEDSYDKWHEVKDRLKTIENDDQFVDMLLNLLDEELIEKL